MPTGAVKGKKPVSRNHALRAVGLRFERSRLVVAIEDGREVAVPLEWYPSLEQASPVQRRRWVLLGDGMGFSWPELELDLDLSLAGLVSGLPEVVPPPPARAGRRSS